MHGCVEMQRLPRVCFVNIRPTERSGVETSEAHFSDGRAREFPLVARREGYELSEDGINQALVEEGRRHWI